MANWQRKALELSLCVTSGLFGLAGCYLPPPNTNPSLEDQVRLEDTLRSALTQATADLRQGDEPGLDRAFAALEVARDLAPNDPRVFDGLGAVEYRRRNSKLAESFFKRAISLNPDYDRPYAHLALIAEDRGDRAAAIELLKLAIKLNPLNFRARNNLAKLLKDDGADAEAYKELLKAYQSGAQDDIVIAHNLKHNIKCRDCGGALQRSR